MSYILQYGRHQADAQTLTIPNAADHKPTESLAATPSATPLPNRDADVADIAPPRETPVAAVATPQPAQQETKEDLGAIEWYYRDPAGQEQGELLLPCQGLYAPKSIS